MLASRPNFLSLFGALFLFCFSSQALSDEVQDDDHTVWVYGHRNPQAHSVRDTGLSTKFQPEDESRFDSASNLKRDSSVLLPETGRISPSGFVVPRIRGQDVKLTDVFIEDILVQDPYAGLPLVEDLDLRGFGSFELFPGLSPPDVPSLNPIGTLRYRFRPYAHSSESVGVLAGRPFGSAVWAMAKEIDEDKKWSGQIYGRTHQSNGRFPYYSDEGTPYNSSDDEIRIRDNNDQRSYQALPRLSYHKDDLWVSALGLVYQSERGLPSLSAKTENATREQSHGHLSGVSVKKELAKNSESHSSSLEMSVGESEDQRAVSDPGNLFIGVSDHSQLQVRSKRARGGWRYEDGLIQSHLSSEWVQSHIQSDLGDSVGVGIARESLGSTIGFALRPLDWLIVEEKSALRSIADKDVGSALSSIPGEPKAETIKRFSRGNGVALAILPKDWASVYGQFAVSERPPSLLEEYGDGGGYRPNSDLVAEKMRHLEVGAQLRSVTEDKHLSIAAYQDQTFEKIVVVPALGSAVKSANLRQALVKGADVKGDWRIIDTTFYLSYSRLLPLDVTGDERRFLPGTPEYIYVAEVDQRIAAMTARWFYRQRSAVYRDLENTVVLPEVGIHDLSLDYAVTSQQLEERFAVGLSVKNVFDVKDLPVSAPGSPNSKGRTALSEISGDPVPGRQWLISSSARF